MPIYGGIEGGGTKFVCAVGSSPNDIIDEIRFPTTTPDETLGKAVEYFKKFSTGTYKIDALGVATFGPIDPVLGTSTYGHIMATPKAGWAHCDVVGTLKKGLGLKVGFEG